MPTYEYACRACNHEFELFQQMTDPVKRKCPECGQLKLDRLIGTGAGVLFKGSGFYETDYRSDSYRKAAEAEKKAAEGTSSSDKSDGAADKKSSASGNGKAASSNGQESKGRAKKSESKKPARSKSRGTGT